MMPPANPLPAERYAFLDQCRGYAVFGMILVNVLGLFECMPWMLKHHHAGFSYADHIAPLFIFVVGMGFRMSFLKTVREEGYYRTYARSIRRYCILMGLGLVYGGFHLPAAVWDALMDIGAAGMLALPFMHAGTAVRIAAAAGYLALYQGLYSCTPYGDWVLRHSINGGPLGPLSWACVLLLGTAAMDYVRAHRGKALAFRFSLWSAVLCGAGWALRAEWPGCKSLWPFSQYGMSAPYPLYAAGLCFITVLFFYGLCEGSRIRLPHFTSLGRNALVIYLLQAVLVLAVRMLFSSQLSVIHAVTVFFFVYGICCATAWHLDRTRRYIKIGG